MFLGCFCYLNLSICMSAQCILIKENICMKTMPSKTKGRPIDHLDPREEDQILSSTINHYIIYFYVPKIIEYVQKQKYQFA